MSLQRGDGLRKPVQSLRKNEPKWNDERIRDAYMISAIYGATDEILCKIMRINISTLGYWKKKYPEFNELLQAGKHEANAKVANAMYESCFDRWVEEEVARTIHGKLQVVKIKKCIPANPLLQLKFLAIRAPEIWSSRNDLEITHNNNNINMNFNFDVLSKDELKLVRKLQLNRTPEIEDIGTVDD
jgi:hypothetical protein